MLTPFDSLVVWAMVESCWKYAEKHSSYVTSLKKFSKDFVPIPHTVYCVVKNWTDNLMPIHWDPYPNFLFIKGFSHA